MWCCSWFSSPSLFSIGKLEELNLSSNNLMAEEFRELKSPLSNLTQLKTLNLSNNSVFARDSAFVEIPGRVKAK